MTKEDLGIKKRIWGKGVICDNDRFEWKLLVSIYSYLNDIHLMNVKTLNSIFDLYIQENSTMNTDIKKKKKRKYKFLKLRKKIVSLFLLFR